MKKGQTKDKVLCTIRQPAPDRDVELHEMVTSDGTYVTIKQGSEHVHVRIDRLRQLVIQLDRLDNYYKP